jgi:hypothetical protein
MQVFGIDFGGGIGCLRAARSGIPVCSHNWAEFVRGLAKREGLLQPYKRYRAIQNNLDLS